MSTAAEMWKPGEPPRDGQYYLCWCSFNYGGGQEIVARPIVLRSINRDFEEWEWDDNECAFWGTIEFHAEIENP